MRPRVVLVTAAVIASTPLLVLAALVAGGAAAAGPALLAGVLVVTSAVLLAMLWLRDQTMMIEEVRRVADGMQATDVPMGLRSNIVLMAEIERLIRVLSDRTAAANRQLHVEEAIVETLPDPLILLTADRSVLRANAAAHAAFGTEMQAVLRHPGLRSAIDRTLARGMPQAADLALPVPVPREVHAIVFTVGETDRRPPAGAHVAGAHVAVVLSDRTRERALERMRADFVANASHELRTPLASLIGFIDTLRGPAADDLPAQARFLQIMSEQAGRMNRLIDDLLNLSRVELTEHQPPIGRVALPELVHWVAAAFEPRVTTRGIRLDLTVPPDLPPVDGDEEQLTQVLQNLLDNAFKYGKEGGTVRRVAQAVPPGGLWPARPGVTVAVSDDGQGIGREHLPRLTERFYRIDKGRSRAVGGTGLGLATVKHIVNRHRGRLVIDSQVGEGSTFTVWLPVSGPVAATGRHAAAE